MLLKNSVALVCKSFWLKLNSSCIIVLFKINTMFHLTLQNYYKILLKLVSIYAKKTKKCIFLHFFDKFHIFCYGFPTNYDSSIVISGYCLISGLSRYHSDTTPKGCRKYTDFLPIYSQYIS